MRRCHARRTLPKFCAGRGRRRSATLRRWLREASWPGGMRRPRRARAPPALEHAVPLLRGLPRRPRRRRDGRRRRRAVRTSDSAATPLPARRLPRRRSPTLEPKATDAWPPAAPAADAFAPFGPPKPYPKATDAWPAADAAADVDSRVARRRRGMAEGGLPRHHRNAPTLPRVAFPAYPRADPPRLRQADVPGLGYIP